MEKTENCILCSAHCPKDRLKCGKGKRFFEKRDGKEGEYPSLPPETEQAPAAQNPLEENLTQQLMKCGFILNQKTHHHRGQGKILRLLKDRPEMTQKELQRKLEIEAGSLSETLSKLEARGLILRKKEEKDKRRVTVFLTAAGRAQAERENGERLDSLYKMLSEDEKETLCGLLFKLTDTWNAEYRARGGVPHENPEVCFGRDSGAKRHGKGHGKGEGGHGKKGRTKKD